MLSGPVIDHQTKRGSSLSSPDRRAAIDATSQHQTPDTRHQTPDTRHQTPDTRHQTPDTRGEGAYQFQFFTLLSTPSVDVRH